MLLQLKVKNFALIEDIQIDFSSGLNIITGQTGSGKSLIISALHLLMGKRNDHAQNAVIANRLLRVYLNQTIS